MVCEQSSVDYTAEGSRHHCSAIYRTKECKLLDRTERISNFPKAADAIDATYSLSGGREGSHWKENIMIFA